MQTLIHDFKTGPRADRGGNNELQRAKSGTLETFLLIMATAVGVMAAVLADQYFNIFS